MDVCTGLSTLLNNQRDSTFCIWNLKFEIWSEIWILHIMFTQAALHACVFALKRFLCQMQCFDWLTRLWGFHLFHAWPKSDFTHTEDNNFQLCKIIFLEYRTHNALRVNMGLKGWSPWASHNTPEIQLIQYGRRKRSVKRSVLNI